MIDATFDSDTGICYRDLSRMQNIVNSLMDQPSVDIVSLYNAMHSIDKCTNGLMSDFVCNKLLRVARNIRDNIVLRYAINCEFKHEKSANDTAAGQLDTSRLMDWFEIERPNACTRLRYFQNEITKKFERSMGEQEKKYVLESSNYKEN